MKGLLLFLLLIISACSDSPDMQNKPLNVIDVAGSLSSERTVNISEIADSVEYIALETKKGSFISTVLYDNIFYENKLIYIFLKNGSITLFNDEGKHIREFSRMGRGPEEYSWLSTVDVNPISGNIYIKGYRKIYEYSINGDFINSIRFPEDDELKNLLLFHFKKLGDFYIATSHIFWDTRYSGVIIDSASNVVMKLDYPKEQLDYLVSLPRKRIPDYVNPKLFRYKDKIRIINGNNKHILSINKDLSIDTAYIINYGKFSPIFKPGKRLLVDSPYLWRRFEAFESDNYVFMTFHVGPLTKRATVLQNPLGKEYVYHHSHSLFNKKNGEFLFLAQPDEYQLGFKEDIHGGPAIWPMYISSDNYLVSKVKALDLIRYVNSNNVSEELKTLVASLKEDNNPVIVRAKLKISE